MGRAASVPATYDATTGKSAVVKPRGLQGTQYTASTVSDPTSLARHLTELSAKVTDATATARATPPAQLYKNVIVTTSSNLVIQHSLQRPAQWIVTGWRGASAGASFVEVSRDNQTLVLKAYVAGVVDLELR